MTEENKTYVVEWQEIVTYSVEVEAPNDSEAQDIAQQNYSYDNEVDSSYWDGSMHIEEVQQ